MTSQQFKQYLKTTNLTIIGRYRNRVEVMNDSIYEVYEYKDEYRCIYGLNLGQL